MYNHLDEQEDGVYSGSCTIEQWFEAYDNGYHAAEWERLYQRSRIMLSSARNIESAMNFTGRIPPPQFLGAE